MIGILETLYIAFETSEMKKKTLKLCTSPAPPQPQHTHKAFFFFLVIPTLTETAHISKISLQTCLNFQLATLSVFYLQ